MNYRACGMSSPRTLRAPRGPEHLDASGWVQEAALRMLHNNLDPEVAERPEDLGSCVRRHGQGRSKLGSASTSSFASCGRSAETRPCSSSRARPSPGFAPTPMRPGFSSPNPNSVAWVGHVGRVPAARGHGPHDVRPDDGGLVDLHRDPGHLAGHLRDLRRRPKGLRGTHEEGRTALGAHGRSRGNGRRAAARRHDGGAELSGDRGRPVAHREVWRPVTST